MAEIPRKNALTRPLAGAASDAETSTTTPKIDVELKRSSAGYGGSMLDSALYNLIIAQQYIDETNYLAEHRLISFHHGVALLARYRNNPDKLMVAHQCFSDAANWRIDDDDWQQYGDAYLQIVSEARYNLGVIDELLSKPEEALEHYKHAIALDAKRHTAEWNGVKVLACFGTISAAVSLLMDEERRAETYEQDVSAMRRAAERQIEELRRMLKGSSLPPVAQRIARHGPSAAERENVERATASAIFDRALIEEAAAKTTLPFVTAGEVADESKNLALIRIERKLEEFEKLLARKFGRAQREGV